VSRELTHHPVRFVEQDQLRRVMLPPVGVLRDFWRVCRETEPRAIHFSLSGAPDQ
jgi:hypothetical protein